MDYPFLSKFWMFIAKKYSTFNEFIFFTEYSVLLTMEFNTHLSLIYAFPHNMDTSKVFKEQWKERNKYQDIKDIKETKRVVTHGYHL